MLSCERSTHSLRKVLAFVRFKKRIMSIWQICFYMYILNRGTHSLYSWLSCLSENLAAKLFIIISPIYQSVKPYCAFLISQLDSYQSVSNSKNITCCSITCLASLCNKGLIHLKLKKRWFISLQSYHNDRGRGQMGSNTHCGTI